MQDAIVVTGATGALGRAVIERLAQAGRTVVAFQRSSPAAMPGASLTVAEGDLSDDANARRAFTRVGEHFEKIGGVVNVAGGFAWEKIEGGSLSTWERMFAMNLKTAFNSCNAAIPLIRTGGAIVNLGAMSATQSGAGVGAYTAAKSGVARLTESLAAELKGRIRVNAVLPSIIDTPSNRRDMPESDFSKWVSPVELANVIAFLLSDEASAITGALIPVTGRV